MLRYLDVPNLNRIPFEDSTQVVGGQFYAYVPIEYTYEEALDLIAFSYYYYPTPPGERGIGLARPDGSESQLYPIEDRLCVQPRIASQGRILCACASSPQSAGEICALDMNTGAFSLLIDPSRVGGADRLQTPDF